MIRMLVVGYVFAIRSERALCREVQLNLAYRWFCGLGIEDRIPDHSAFSRARNERFCDSDIFRRVFERVVGTCIAAGLVGGETFSIDALPMRCLGVLRAVRHPSTGVSALMRSRRQTETKIYFQNSPPI